MDKPVAHDGTPTVLITGCSSGIGQATAERFLDHDWCVYATARQLDDLSELGNAGAEIAELDVTDRESITRVVKRIIDDEGRIDCLVNNAGYGEFGPLEDVSVKRVHSQFDVNVYGPTRMIQAVLPTMREQERGRIINVSAGYGRMAVSGTSVYAASKFALEGLSDALRTELAPYGIQVSVIDPGPVTSGFVDRSEAALEGVERTPAYRWVYEGLEQMSEQDPSGGVIQRIIYDSPERLAGVIYDAANSSRPRARYAVGVVAWGTELVRYLPTGFRDRVVERMVPPRSGDDHVDQGMPID